MLSFLYVFWAKRLSNNYHDLDINILKTEKCYYYLITKHHSPWISHSPPFLPLFLAHYIAAVINRWYKTSPLTSNEKEPFSLCTCPKSTVIRWTWSMEWTLSLFSGLQCWHVTCPWIIPVPSSWGINEA